MSVRRGLAAVFGLTACGAAPPSVPAPPTDAPEPPKTFALYLLAGQSNMDGYGFVRDLPRALRGEASDVFIHQPTATPDGAPSERGAWSPLRPGHGTGFLGGETPTLGDRFGPELTFGRTIRQRRPQVPVAIVKVSFGGTSLTHGVGFGSWDPDAPPDARPNQYDHALAALRGAADARDVDGDGAPDRLVPAGIVWMQGEADAIDQRAAARYEANLAHTIGLLRAAMRRADLPVVIGRIEDSGSTPEAATMPHADEVRAAQVAYAERDACAGLVTATHGIGFAPDGWHYDSAGYRRLGVAFAEAMDDLQERCSPGRGSVRPLGRTEDATLGFDRTHHRRPRPPNKAAPIAKLAVGAEVCGAIWRG